MRVLIIMMLLMFGLMGCKDIPTKDYTRGGDHGGSNAPIPEPLSIVMLAVGVGYLVRRRK